MVSSMSETSVVHRTPVDSKYVLRTVLHIAIGAIAFVIVCGVIRSFFPFHDVPLVSSKLDHLRLAGGSYDTLFIGSSRIRQHIDPLLFDRLCHEAGIETNSYNFGIPALIIPELPFVVDEILRIRPPRL